MGWEVCLFGDVRVFVQWSGGGRAWGGGGWVECRCRPGRFRPEGQPDWRIVLGCGGQWARRAALAVAVGVRGSAQVSIHCGCASLEVAVAVPVGVGVVLQRVGAPLERAAPLEVVGSVLPSVGAPLELVAPLETAGAHGGSNGVPRWPLVGRHSVRGLRVPWLC